MNSDNFGSKNSDMRESAHPSTLSVSAKVFLLLICSFSMMMCGILNTVVIYANDLSLLTFTGIIAVLVYFVAGGICALLALEAPKLAAIPPIFSFVSVAAVALFLGGGSFRIAFLASALLSLFPSVGGTALAICIRKGIKRPSAILVSSVATAIFTAIVLVLSVYLAGGVINGDVILSVIDQARGRMTELVSLQLELVKNEFPQYDFSNFDAVASVNTVFNLLPALVILVFNSIAFFSNLSLLALLRILDLYHKLDRSDIEFKVSAVTAVVFVLSYIMSAVMAENDSAALAVFNNLSMILMPAMAVTGLMYILPKKDGNTVRIGCFPLMITGALMLYVPALGILLLSIFGSFYTLKESVTAYKNKNKE